MTRATTCTICDHSEREAIDIALAGGSSLRQLADRFDVGRMALQRHRKSGHVSPALTPVTVDPGSSSAPSDDIRSSLDRIEELYRVARHLMTAAVRDGKTSMTLAAVSELRRVVELLAKISGELRERPTTVVNVLASSEWLAVRDAVLTALERHPEARTDVVEALAVLEAGEQR